MDSIPNGWSFARVAWEALSHGDAPAALQICREGIPRHPNYVTGYLVLARSYEALGRYTEAAIELRGLEARLPASAAVAELLARVEQAEQDEFEDFAARRGRSLTAARDSISLETFGTGEETPATEDAVDFLLRQVEEVRKTAPTVRPAEGGESRNTASEPAKIVTPTLAEIYASQGEYDAAIAAYARLMELRPEERARFRARVEELDIIARSRQGK